MAASRIERVRSLDVFREALRDIDYAPELIIPEYRYATLKEQPNALEGGAVSTIDLAAFCRFPPTYQDACIGVVFANGLKGALNVVRHRDLGAHIIFEVDEAQCYVQPWSVRAAGSPRLAGRKFRLDNTREVFAKHQAVWGPSAMRSAKRGGPSGEQADFFDVMLMPLLAHEFQTKLGGF